MDWQLINNIYMYIRSKLYIALDAQDIPTSRKQQTDPTNFLNKKTDQQAK